MTKLILMGSEQVGEKVGQNYLEHIPKASRRIILKNARRAEKPTSKISISAPTFEEESVVILEKQEKLYSEMVRYNGACVLMYRLMESLGADNAFLKSFAETPDYQEQILKSTHFFSEAIVSGKISARELNKRATPFVKTLTHKKHIIFDIDFPDDLSLPEYLDIPYSQILAEQVRVEGENLDLLRLHLFEKRTARKKAKKELKTFEREIQREALAGEKKNKTPQLEANEMAQDVVEEEVNEQSPISVSPGEQLNQEQEPITDWTLVYTINRFSDEEQYLIPFRPAGISGLATQLGEITFREGQSFGSSPQHVIDNVLFHLGKDKLQRAMALRNKYWYPDWSKIGRGSLRIFCKINEQEKRCVFFAGQRKDIYENR